MVCVLFEVLTVHAADDLCSHITETSNCIKSYTCDDKGNSFYIWENCAVNEVLFTVDSPTILKSDESDVCGGYLVLADNKINILLGGELDAERSGGRPITCEISIGSPIPAYVFPLDINEFSPQPQDGSYVSEISLEENLANTEVCNFAYVDDDKGETETLSISWVSSEFQDQFEMTQESNVFTLSTKDALDYEARSVYKIVFDIISTDELGTQKNATHTVLLFVIDVGDTKPYWLHREPTASIPEGNGGRFVYYVEAADRDYGINNKIKYSITNGNDDDFFIINGDDGKVTLKREIDYETDPTFFTLTVTAQEYTKDGQIAPDPSKDETITNINIEDKNDNSPTFNSDEYSTIMGEAYDKPVLIDLDMFIDDPDSAGNFNRFTIISDCKDLEISPSDGRGNTSVKLYAQPKTGGVFDYDFGEDSVTILLTATEIADPTHFQSVTLNIKLEDKNDHPPIFEYSSYDVSLEESKKAGDEVVIVEAYDGDKSALYGNESISYFSVNCTNTLAVDRKSGRVTLAQDNALDYEVEQNLCCAVEARDALGDAEYLRDNSVINIAVIDVNDSPPTIAVQNGTIRENSESGTSLDIKINASDPDTSASLRFSIQWERSTAYKDDAVVSIEKVIKWFVVVKTEDEEISSAVLRVGTKKPDREVADTLRLSVMVTDDKTAATYQAKDSEFVEIKILDENDTPPEFVGDYTDLKVLENSVNGTKIALISASDADENDAVVFSIDEDTYFRIEQETDFSGVLMVSGNAEIDREEREIVQVTITIEDKNSHPTSQMFTVNILDENDNPPIFQKKILFATFTPYDKPGKSLLVFEADDKDQNENLNYQMADDFEWPEGGPDPPPNVPFTVQKKEGNNADLLLNFDPLGVNSGYCTFTVICNDNNGKHSASVQGKVYAITTEFEVAVVYGNTKSDTSIQRIAIQNTFEEVYGFPCFIDSIDEGEDETKSVVKMHFIDDGKNEPVQADRIIEMSNVYSISQELIAKNEELGLNILSVGSVTQESGGSVNGILILEILLGVVSFVLGSLLLLLIITYFIRTRSLERKLKVATTTTFGSVASDLNRMDVASGVPGSNKFAGEGANPMYNLSESYLRNDDSSSVGSGDSVLVGVEDNPEFREYSADTKRAPKGQSNPAFSRSIDDVAAPSPFSGGTRTNPLMDMDINGEDGDLSDALHNYELSLRRQSIGSELVSGNSDGAFENTNFSFGNKM
ncbi:cadherin EGF LAG seven-pass G-type receptor 2-like isoform X2 [Palaemon carinicauda]|uniref:cadherin EGF LAG seven-pass G-type receptor 2-like isoform X2 n=1 Tax=Palaemon carinicauda TaxID=392227 RepID=UPI0035B57962